MRQKIIIMLLLFSVFIPLVQAGCCYSPFPITGVSGDGIYEATNGACTSIPDTVYIGDCIFPPTGNSLNMNCCCDNSDFPIDFGASNNNNLPPNTVYELYCLSYEGFSLGEFNNGVCTCAGGANTGQTGDFHVTGYVSTTIDNQIYYLKNVSVQEQYQGLEDQTNNLGYYDLGAVPGADVGPNEFKATITDQTTINVDDEEHYISCPQETIQQILSEGASNGVEINFTLSCQIQEPVCQTDWMVGEWSDCIFFSGEFVKIRDVWDANECETTNGQPISILTQTTPGDDGFTVPSPDFDCPSEIPSGYCNNGILDFGEQCEINQSSGIPQYLDPLTGEATFNAPSCYTLGFSPESTGLVTCRNDCSFDTTQCSNPCDSFNCECPEYANSPLCQTECDDLGIIFLPEYDSSSTNRNVLESYSQDDDFTGVKYTEGSNDVEVIWKQKDQSSYCNNLIMDYYVKICPEDPEHPGMCLPYTETIYLSGQSQTELKIIDLLHPNHESYCYNICSVTVDGNQHCVYEQNDLACFNAGNPVCYQDHELGLNCEFEEETNLFHPTGCYHDENGRTNHSSNISHCELGEYCFETQYNPTNTVQFPGANCLSVSNCTLCNGLFGLFAAHNLQTTIEINGVNESVYCLNTQYSFLNNVNNLPDFDNALGRCYEDKAEKTPFTFYNTCEQVKDCYDYKTQNTCSNDPCFKFIGQNDTGLTNNCEWRFLDEQLGVGVCAPTIIEEENCRKCDDESPLGFCNEDLCSLYGDCYFKETQNRKPSTGLSPENNLFKQDPQLKLVLHNPADDPFLSTCIHKRDMACFFYQSEEDCIGENPQNASIQAVYNDTSGKGIRIGGNNSQENYSSDYFGFGDCEWIDSGESKGCFKNSDSYITLQQNRNLSDDCFDTSSSTKLSCLKDTTPPNTTISLRDPVEREEYNGSQGEYLPVYGKNELNNISFLSTDDVSSSQKILTKISLIPSSCQSIGCHLDLNCTQNCLTNKTKINACMQQNCSVYPLYSLEDYQEGSLQFNQISSRTINEEYLIIYYSQDQAKNLEEVKKTYIFVDVEGPDLLNFTTEINSFIVYEDIYSSNLSIEFTIDEPSLCFTNLTNEQTPNIVIAGYSPVINDTHFNAEYRYLPDGNYIYNIHCLDDYGNDLNIVKNIPVEGNAAIINPKPRGLLFNNTDILLKIETINVANCKFDSEKRTFEDSREYFQEGSYGLTHEKLLSSEMNEIEINPQESKSYFFYTSCQFTDGSITEQNEGDIISFTVDKLPPKVIVQARTDPLTNFETYIDVDENWTDSREFKLICDDYDAAIPIQQFGCKQINYCFGSYNQHSHEGGNFCESELFTIYPEDENTFLLYAQDYAYKRMYYQAIDNGGNIGDFESVHLKLKDTTFGDPIIYIE